LWDAGHVFFPQHFWQTKHLMTMLFGEIVSKTAWLHVSSVTMTMCFMHCKIVERLARSTSKSSSVFGLSSCLVACRFAAGAITGALAGRFALTGLLPCIICPPAPLANAVVAAMLQVHAMLCRLRLHTACSAAVVFVTAAIAEMSLSRLQERIWLS